MFECGFSRSSGYYHTALVTEDGRLLVLGNNDDGQLGLETSSKFEGPLEVSMDSPIKAVACGNQHTVILTNDGDVLTCGT
jgi:alpha-tubulin suppressor-like RCC1 family protein